MTFSANENGWIKTFVYSNGSFLHARSIRMMMMHDRSLSSSPPTLKKTLTDQITKLTSVQQKKSTFVYSLSIFGGEKNKFFEIGIVWIQSFSPIKCIRIVLYEFTRNHLFIFILRRRRKSKKKKITILNHSAYLIMMSCDVLVISNEPLSGTLWFPLKSDWSYNEWRSCHLKRKQQQVGTFEKEKKQQNCSFASDTCSCEWMNCEQ